MDTARRRGEELIFKPKFPIIYTEDFIYINSSLWKINQGLNLEKMPVFVVSVFFFLEEGGGRRVNSYVAKPGKLAVGLVFFQRCS